MKIDINDPRITAFALGELSGSDAIEIARAVRADARVRAAVDEARETSCLLRGTLGGGEVHLLTPDQREAVRSAGSRAAITDIASARVPFWKNPAVAGLGVAAAVALAVYIVGGRTGTGSGGGMDDPPAKWDWAQVDLGSLTAPVVGDASGHPGVGTPDGSGHAVSAAVRDDTTSFREEVKRRIAAMPASEIESGAGLPQLEGNSGPGWSSVAADQRLKVPMATGATSWPWIVRSIRDQKKLPPRRAVRIEEMVNHFRYKKPTMTRGGGLVADMEICHTPWNPVTALLAVHVQADSVSAPADAAAAALSLNPERVRRVRLIGYARSKNGGPADGWGGPSRLSRSHGNYVIYELEMIERDGALQAGAIATLTLGLGDAATSLPVGRVADWMHASADLRFASAISACGLLLNDALLSGQLDTKGLLSLVDSIEERDSTVLGGGRRGALEIMRQAAGVIDATSRK